MPDPNMIQTRDSASSELYREVEDRLSGAFEDGGCGSDSWDVVGGNLTWGEVAMQLECGNWSSNEDDVRLAKYLREMEVLWYEYGN